MWWMEYKKRKEKTMGFILELQCMRLTSTPPKRSKVCVLGKVDS